MEKHKVMRFDSWGAFLQAATGETDCPMKDRIGHRDSYEDDSFHGGINWDESLQLAKDGWKEIRPEVTAMTDRIKDDLKPIMVTTFDRFNDVSGSMVDMDAYLTGEPMNMINLMPVKVAKPGKVITILACISFSGGINHEEITSRGMAICGLIESLEFLQHSTELWVEQTVEGDGHYLTTLVKVKSAEEHLDIDRVMFALAHPCMLRRMIFSLEECQSKDVRRTIGIGDLGSGYGMPTKLMTREIVNPTLALDIMKYNAGYDRGAKSEEWIKGNLEEFGLLK